MTLQAIVSAEIKMYSSKSKTTSFIANKNSNIEKPAAI